MKNAINTSPNIPVKANRENPIKLDFRGHEINLDAAYF